MPSLIALVVILGLSPLVLGMVRLPRGMSGDSPWPGIGSTVLCVLAFNLTFFWQELWLVVPKALTPGLAPVLYHNDHGWTGDAPIVELLQGTGALATLISGVVSLGLLVACRGMSATWRLFLFWMAFQGLFQSLSQFAIGAILPGNDMGRALAFLGLDAATKALLLAVVTMAMGLAGAALAAFAPTGLGMSATYRTRTFGAAMLLTAIACVVLCAPYRVPRNPVEVVMIPAIVNLMGVGWLVFGASIARGDRTTGKGDRIGWVGPLIAAIVVLLVFQVVLRPGIAF